ncbi:MAG: membrane dipeptidase [Hymenobacter sp.]
MLIAVAFAACVRPPDRAAAPISTATDLLTHHPVIDGHNDFGLHYLLATPSWSVSAFDIERAMPGQTDVPRWRAGHVAASFVTLASEVGVPGPDRHARLIASFDWLDLLVARHARALAIASSPKDLAPAQAEGRIALIPAIETGEELGGSLPTGCVSFTLAGCDRSRWFMTTTTTSAMARWRSRNRQPAPRRQPAV